MAVVEPSRGALSAPPQVPEQEIRAAGQKEQTATDRKSEALLLEPLPESLVFPFRREILSGRAAMQNRRGIKASGMKWVASADPAHDWPDRTGKPMGKKSQAGILRARRKEPAGWGQDGRKQLLITPDQPTGASGKGAHLKPGFPGAGQSLPPLPPALERPPRKDPSESLPEPQEPCESPLEGLCELGGKLLEVAAALDSGAQRPGSAGSLQIRPYAFLPPHTKEEQTPGARSAALFEKQLETRRSAGAAPPGETPRHPPAYPRPDDLSKRPAASAPLPGGA